MNRRTSEQEVGLAQVLMAESLRGSIATPRAEMTCPRNATDDRPNWHLLALA